jgi:hypothetical protein
VGGQLAVGRPPDFIVFFSFSTMGMAPFTSHCQNICGKVGREEQGSLGRKMIKGKR